MSIAGGRSAGMSAQNIRGPLIFWFSDTDSTAAGILRPISGGGIACSSALTVVGATLFSDGTAAAPSISFADDTDTGFYRSAGNRISVAIVGTQNFEFRSTSFSMLSNTMALRMGTANDTQLHRDAANTLALRNSTNAQHLRIYETYTDGSNFERYSLVAGSNRLEIAAGTAGSGADNLDIRLAPAGTGEVRVTGPLAVSNVTEGNIGKASILTAHEAHTLAAAGTSDTTTISIPTGALILGASLTVNETVVDSAGDDTWAAAFITGSTTAIAAAGTAAAIDTKIDTLIVPEVSTATAQIQFTAQGGNFSAGVIECLVYYMELTSLADVA